MGVSADHGLREHEQTLSTPAAISQPLPGNAAPVDVQRGSFAD